MMWNKMFGLFFSQNDQKSSFMIKLYWNCFKIILCKLFDLSQSLFFGEQVCVPLLQFLFGSCGESASLLKNKEEFGDLKCPPTPTNNKLMTEHMLKTPTSNVRRSLKDVGTPKTPSIISANLAQSTKKRILCQGCEILYQLLWNGETSLSKDCTGLRGNNYIKPHFKQTVKVELYQ